MNIIKLRSELDKTYDIVFINKLVKLFYWIKINNRYKKSIFDKKITLKMLIEFYQLLLLSPSIYFKDDNGNKAYIHSNGNNDIIIESVDNINEYKIQSTLNNKELDIILFSLTSNNETFSTAMSSINTDAICRTHEDISFISNTLRNGIYATYKKYFFHQFGC